MATVTLSSVQEALIDKIAKENSLGEHQIEKKKGGVGSFGSIIAITIKENGKKLDYIVKVASINKKVRNMNPVRKAYLREIYMYEDVLPAFKTFQNDAGLINNGFSAYPKCVGNRRYETNECLVLENLTETGYSLWDKKLPMNSQHVAIVFSEYAKFHAASLAMSSKKPEMYCKLTKELSNVFDNHSQAMAKTALEEGKKAVEGKQVYTDALDRLAVDLGGFLEELESAESKLVVIHNDGWINNFMFKYEDDKDIGRPTSVKIIDWQLAQKGSPVMDLSYFIYTCGDADVITNYADYLKIYHDIVSANLRSMNCEVEVVFPYSLLENHWKKYSKFGLFMALIMIKFMLSEDNEVPNISEMARSGMTFVDRLKFESVNNDQYTKRIIDIVKVMVENELI